MDLHLFRTRYEDARKPTSFPRDGVRVGCVREQ